LLRFRLLGDARAFHPTGEFELERKTAACLTLLAVEGRVARARVSAALWPDAAEGAARGNLRQVARRLRVAGGVDALGGSDPLELDPGIVVDVRQLLSRAMANDWASVADAPGKLLAGMVFDDCPDFAEWLELTRTRLDWTRAHALSIQSSRVERTRCPGAAIPLLLRWLEIDPLAEEAYRRLMRLHHGSGDRGAALRAFETCRAALRTHLDVEPSHPTLALAREIRGSASSPPLTARRRTSREMPLSLLRPPIMVGRDEALEALERGLDAGKLIFVTGAAGIGKTRLVDDFAASHPELEHRYVACRPGDRELPYSYFARVWRYDLGKYPERGSRMAPWVRSELARIMPELGPVPPPIETPEQRLRFFDANLELAKENDTSLLITSDDAHHLDPASHELGMHLGMYFIAKSSRLRSVSTYRPEELDADARSMLDVLCDGGQAVAINLLPLNEADLAQMLDGLELPRTIMSAERILEVTGGVPFFVVETLKAIHEADGDSDEAVADAASPSDRVAVMITRRLQRLSATARRVLEAAAVLDEPLRFSLAQTLLSERRERLAEAWSELERGLLLRDGVVAHELLRTVVLRSIARPDRELWHARVAMALEEAGAHPARIACHLRDAGDGERAATFLDRAAGLSRAMMRTDEAEAFGRDAHAARAARPKARDS
jgi:DNA-binding SARP family transcriptional activator